MLPAQFFAEFLSGVPMQSEPDRFKEKLIFIQKPYRSVKNMERDMHDVHLKYSKDCIKISFPNVQMDDKKPFSLSPRNFLKKRAVETFNLIIGW